MAKSGSYTTTLGEVIKYPEPAADVAAFLRRVEDAAEDPRVTEDELISLIYGTENPILVQGKFEGRGAVTKEVLANPLYAVLTDLLQHKRIALGATSPAALKSAFTVTVAQAAEQIGNITLDGVRRACRSGRLVSIQTDAGILIDPRSVADFAAERKPRGPVAGSVLRVAFGSDKGKSFRIKFASVDVKSKKTRGDLTISHAEIPTFQRGAIAFSDTKKDGSKINRCFILEPATRAREGITVEDAGAPKGSRYALEPFSIEGLFKVVQTENNPQKAAQLFKSFEPS